MHRKSVSTTDLQYKGLKLDKIINECSEVKKDVSGNASRLSQQLDSQISEWKYMENFLKSQQMSMKSKSGEVSKEIRQKLKDISEKQYSEKARRLSKFMIMTKDQPITDRELKDNDTFKFLMENKREFGSPQKEILFTKPKGKARSSDFLINPEETVLDNIFTIREQQNNYRVKRKELKLNRDNVEKISKNEESKSKDNKMSARNKIIYKEMKKIEPINSNNIAKRGFQVVGSMSILQKTSSKFHQLALRKSNQ